MHSEDLGVTVRSIPGRNAPDDVIVGVRKRDHGFAGAAGVDSLDDEPVVVVKPDGGPAPCALIKTFPSLRARMVMGSPERAVQSLGRKDHACAAGVGPIQQAESLAGGGDRPEVGNLEGGRGREPIPRARRERRNSRSWPPLTAASPKASSAIEARPIRSASASLADLHGIGPNPRPTGLRPRVPVAFPASISSLLSRHGRTLRWQTPLNYWPAGSNKATSSSLPYPVLLGQDGRGTA